MDMKKFFESPLNPLHKQYEALRAYYLEGKSRKTVLSTFGISSSYFKKICYEHSQAIRSGENPFFAKRRPGPKSRFTAQHTIQDVIALRKKNHSIADIQAILCAKGQKLSLSCIHNLLKDEGFAPLPRRTRQERMETLVPKTLESPTAQVLEFNDEHFHSEKGAGPLVFLPLLEQLGIIHAIKKAGYPGTSQIPAISYLLSLLALKVIGNERHAHDEKWNLDRGLGLFAGLNVLPKAASIASYSYMVTREMNRKFLIELASIFKSENGDFNLDFKTIPHWGDESVLEKNWAGSKSKAIKSVLALLVQNPDSGFLIYSDAEIKHRNQSDGVLEFVDFWKESSGKCPKMLIFDSKFTTYKNLSSLNADGIKFLTLRRRGGNLKKSISNIDESAWATIKLEGKTRKYPIVRTHESRCNLRHYDGEVRQIIIKDNGRENPAILITNDFESPVATLVRKYARRWLVEQEIAEQVSFFHLNQPSSSIVVKVDFDLTLSLLTHNLYRVLAARLDGFENCTVPTLFRNFLDTGARVEIKQKEVVVHLKKKTHMPILFSLPWMNAKSSLPWMGASISFQSGTVS